MLITNYDYSSLNIKTVVHVGANIGEELQFYRDIGVTKIYFFEPRENALKELMENCKSYYSDISITVFPIGLGSEKKEKTLYIAGQSSSFLAPNLHLKIYPETVFNTQQTLSVRRGDQILSDTIEIDMLNIDVQGFELEVLKGMGNLLNKTKLIYTEINMVELYDNCPTLEYLDAYLYSFKFKRIRTELAVAEWGDAIYLRQ